MFFHSKVFFFFFFFFKNGPILASFSVYFRLFNTLQFKFFKLKKSVDGVLGIRTRAAGWKARTNPLSYGGNPHFPFKSYTPKFWHNKQTDRMGKPRPLFHNFRLFKLITIFISNKCDKMSIQYIVPGLTTFGT